MARDPKKGSRNPARGSRRTADPRRAVGKTYIAGDLFAKFETNQSESNAALAPVLFDVILEVNADAPGGARAVRSLLLSELTASPQSDPGLTTPLYKNAAVHDRDAALPWSSPVIVPPESVALNKSMLTDRYIFARLTRNSIERIVDAEIVFPQSKSRPIRAFYKAWLDHPVQAFVFRSANTIKADAAAIAFSARGEKIIWAVADSGIDSEHPHFLTHDTLKLPDGLRHLDFTADDVSFDEDMESAKKDPYGHGTHVAGVIAGECRTKKFDRTSSLRELTVTRDIRRGEDDYKTVKEEGPARISGVAPLCKLMSLRVLDDDGDGNVSTLIAAIGYLQRVNNYGQRIRVHGLNLSVGYEFEVDWFAAGRSPLCNEVDRLVRSGVVVVTAAGNAGYGRVNASDGGQEPAALDATISDPGNAELCITVGSTHRDMPHAYGVSFFSSKGPTADGRAKPDLLAPGERIISAAANTAAATVAHYREDSGTSMAAPHVSGAIAAFLSIRSEFIGRPEAVKELFLATATDLKRLPHYQGKGLVDLMRAIQAV